MIQSIEHPKKTIWQSLCYIVLVGGLLYVYLGNKQRFQELLSSSPPEASNDKTGTGTDNSRPFHPSMLTCSDNSMIVLDSSANGLLHTPDGVVSYRHADKMLLYQYAVWNGDHVRQFAYNQVNTFGGNQCSILLPDSSEVWLNAGSSLRFPVQFLHNQRSVQLSGEAFFRIAPMHSGPAKQPAPFKVFYINSSGYEDTVYLEGAAININTFRTEEGCKIAVLSGRAALHAVSNPKERVALSGQELLVREKKITASAPADLSASVAWKKGYFQFVNTPVETVMNTIGRWYDVGIVYHVHVNTTFYGKISMHESLDKLLHILESTGEVNFTTKGDTLIVESKKITGRK